MYRLNELDLKENRNHVIMDIYHHYFLADLDEECYK